MTGTICRQKQCGGCRNLLKFFSCFAGLRVDRVATGQRTKKRASRKLVAESCADSDALASLGSTAAKHSGSALGLHAGSEAVSLDALAAVGLKCALGHRNALLSFCGNLCLNGKS